MPIHDISVPVTRELPVWPEDPQVQIKKVQSLDNGGVANVSHLQCSVHTGTHIDAPYHFIATGATVDQIPLDLLVGPAFVCHLPDPLTITADILESSSIPHHTRRLLLRTRNSRLWAEKRSMFYKDYTAITVEAARWIQEHGTKPVVGFIAGLTAPPGRRMGHAGAIIGGKDDTAAAKMKIMKECGLHVVDSPAIIGETMAKALQVTA